MNRILIQLEDDSVFNEVMAVDIILNDFQMYLKDVEIITNVPNLQFKGVKSIRMIDDPKHPKNTCHFTISDRDFLSTRQKDTNHFDKLVHMTIG